MANRAYLYSVSRLPTTGDSADPLRIVGIAEFSYEIPLAFQLLVSGNPRRCPSTIWASPEAEAIAGDYDLGVRCLIEFLDRLQHPEIDRVRDYAKSFLTRDENKNAYFLLEPMEIFAFDEWDKDDPIEELLDYVSSLESVADAKRQELVDAQSRQDDEAASRILLSLGVSNWANALYYSPAGSLRSQPVEVEDFELSDAKTSRVADHSSIDSHRKSAIGSTPSTNEKSVPKWLIPICVVLGLSIAFLRETGCQPEQKPMKKPTANSEQLPPNWQQSEVFRKLYGGDPTSSPPKDDTKDAK